MRIRLGRQEQRNKILILKEYGMLLFHKHGVCENNIKILVGVITIKMQDRVVMSLLLRATLMLLVQITERLPN
jgi:hypothetical protein